MEKTKAFEEAAILQDRAMRAGDSKEIDRYGAFCSDASIRANLDLKRFYEFEIPLPSVEKQKAIAKIYKAYTMRKETNEQLKAQIKDICPILIKGSLEESRA